MFRSSDGHLANGASFGVRPRSSSRTIRVGEYLTSALFTVTHHGLFCSPFQGSMAESCQIAWVQGTHDLYELLSNRLMLGYEYTAKYNLGNSVPYNASFQRCDANLLGGPFRTISTTGRGRFRPIYELAYAHYASTKNLSMPYSAAIVSTFTTLGRCDIYCSR